ncbi:altronate oxidoreductase [Escherichia albertii]|nr:altronate oxidoreductase [Escherichia albertii]
MKTLNRRDFPGAQYPERIIQFGEGNFLRAFVDWQIDLLNEHTDLNAGVVVVRPIDTSFPPSSKQGFSVLKFANLSHQLKQVV